MYRPDKPSLEKSNEENLKLIEAQKCLSRIREKRAKYPLNHEDVKFISAINRGKVTMQYNSLAHCKSCSELITKQHMEVCPLFRLNGKPPSDWLSQLKYQDYSIWELEEGLARELHENVKVMRIRLNAYITEGVIITVPFAKNADLAKTLVNLQLKVDKSIRNKVARADDAAAYDLKKAF